MKMLFKNIIFVVLSMYMILQHTYGEDYAKEVQELFGLRNTIPTLNLYHRGNKSYYIGNIFKANVLHAEQFCRYHDMNLVNIETQEENNFLEEKLFEAGPPDEFFLTSLNRIPNNKLWISLTSGKSLKYFNWQKDEPNNVKKEEQCIIVRTVNKELKWYDGFCWDFYYFICEVIWTKTDQKLLQIIRDKLEKQIEAQA
ncbi:C-type lectin 37Db-like isoform X2 [Diabrotica virgifera virgifera]|uniref:C-type lectin 37Db-like isoform X2 n=1 Tax=Diabrotica virgifera virgifera TaxID=50390 RepID=A0A6P7F170_DIAVI|nr:C-type lectin 37Db-like isoform X2 [Diabrotica virgifera virgifera]